MVVDRILNFTQRLINKVYEHEGATPRVIDLQVKLNTLRSEMNKPEVNEWLQ